MKQNHQDDLSHIRSMMERSSRFISLSGLSGISAGIIALIGACFAHYVLKENNISYQQDYRISATEDVVTKLILIGLGVLIVALFFGSSFTIRNSKKKNLQIWTSTTKRLLANLFIPLATGGIFCFALIYHEEYVYIAPCTLVFYGLALLNASKFTFDDIFYLGLCEIVLGLIGMFFLGYGLIIWALGFGVLHIVYGILLYKKYE